MLIINITIRIVENTFAQLNDILNIVRVIFGLLAVL